MSGVEPPVESAPLIFRAYSDFQLMFMCSGSERQPHRQSCQKGQIQSEQLQGLIPSGAAAHQRQSLQRHKTGLRLDCRLQNCCHGDVREHQPQSDLRPGVIVTEVRDPQQEPHLDSPSVTSGLSDLVTDLSPQYNCYQPILFYD